MGQKLEFIVRQAIFLVNTTSMLLFQTWFCDTCATPVTSCDLRWKHWASNKNWMPSWRERIPCSTAFYWNWEWWWVTALIVRDFFGRPQCLDPDSDSAVAGSEGFCVEQLFMEYVMPRVVLWCFWPVCGQFEGCQTTFLGCLALFMAMLWKGWGKNEWWIDGLLGYTLAPGYVNLAVGMAGQFQSCWCCCCCSCCSCCSCSMYSCRWTIKQRFIAGWVWCCEILGFHQAIVMTYFRVSPELAQNSKSPPPKPPVLEPLVETSMTFMKHT